MRPIGLIAFIFAFCVAAPSFAQDAKQIEAAKKDGKLVVYGTMQSDIFELLQKSFFKKTGITVDYWRTSATKVMERALSEARAGKALFDLVMATEDTMRIMFKEGILAKYDSPMNRDFPKDAIDPDLGPRARNHIVGIVYNKSIINPADAPKTAGRSGQAAIPRQTGHGRPDTAHDDGAMARQRAQTHRQRESGEVRARPRRDETNVSGILRSCRGPRHIRRISDRHHAMSTTSI